MHVCVSTKSEAVKGPNSDHHVARSETRKFWNPLAIKMLLPRSVFLAAGHPNFRDPKSR